MIFLLTGSLIEYAAILFRKQKVSKYGIPSQSVYSDKASAAAAIAAATSSAAAGAFTLATGLAQLGTSAASGAKLNSQPNNRQKVQQDHDEMYDMTSPMVANMYEDSSNQYLINQNQEDGLQSPMSPMHQDNRVTSRAAGAQAQHSNLVRNGNNLLPSSPHPNSGSQRLAQGATPLITTGTPPRKHKMQQCPSPVTKDIGTETETVS